MKFYAAAVDHGDAYVLITPSEEVVVFDTGHPSRANVVINLLKKIGVDKIDYMFLSHSHWDHIGGAPYIMDVYPVDKIYINGEGYPYGTYEKMAKYFGEDADNVHLVSLGDEIDLSGGVRVRILNPKEKLSGTNDNDEEVNNNALVAKISWEDAVVLLPSDIYSDTMKNIMENEDIVAKVLSLPHHGMNGMTGAEREFFAEVHPMVAIKASNYDELKNSTSQELLHELGVLGSTLFATAEYGTLLVEFDGKGSMEVSSGNIVWRE
ncbi:MAG: beta-lactamase-like protein [uncultured bacterium]|nr:MAG: beta-lactamase-like protein [uncultured bacterium]